MYLPRKWVRAQVEPSPAQPSPSLSTCSGFLIGILPWPFARASISRLLVGHLGPGRRLSPNPPTAGRHLDARSDLPFGVPALARSAYSRYERHPFFKTSHPPTVCPGSTVTAALSLTPPQGAQTESTLVSNTTVLQVMQGMSYSTAHANNHDFIGGPQSASLPGHDLRCSVGLLNRAEDGAWRSSGSSELSTIPHGRAPRLL